MKNLLRLLLRSLFRLLYRVEVLGAEHMPPPGQAAVIVANHLSFLDAPILALFLPETPLFAINVHIANLWWVRPFLRLVDTYPLDPANPLAAKAVVSALKKNRKCVVFPEGRITVTGALMKIYEGPGIIADKAGAPIVPVRIDGAQYSPFSRLKGKARRRMFPTITLTVLPPVPRLFSADLKGAERREAAGNALYRLMADMMFETSPYRRKLLPSLIDAVAVHGRGKVILEDARRRPMTYGALLRAVLVLAEGIARKTENDEPVGLMLPNAIALVVSFFALHAKGRVPAMLNHAAGVDAVLSACGTAYVGRVLTSREFVQAAKLEGLVKAMREEGIEILYLEDVREETPLRDKLRGAVLARLLPLMPRYAERRYGGDPDSDAAVLFTSGSEGEPKGVVLSHANIQANRFQLASRIDFSPADHVFNALPAFHAFGLTAGTLLPALSGVRCFLYPSPLHYRTIPEAVYDRNATILFGTDTFLDGYARHAHPYDFYSLRYVFAGAERLKERTASLWTERFGIRILEGYGATEAAPAVAMNTPMRYKRGTVGTALPGMELRLDPVPGMDPSEGGRLFVKGPNVMKGYLLASDPGLLQPPEDGWHDTGDVVRTDGEGFMTVIGRAKRFAKIGGEMVSLVYVESHIERLWPGFVHIAVAAQDERKGEQIVLVTQYAQADRKEIVAYAAAQGMREIAIPRYIHVTEEMPLLAGGKPDYRALALMVTEMFEA